MHKLYTGKPTTHPVKVHPIYGQRTMPEVSKATGISTKHLSNIASGFNRMSVKTAAVLAAYLGYSIKELFVKTDEVYLRRHPKKLNKPVFSSGYLHGTDSAAKKVAAYQSKPHESGV